MEASAIMNMVEDALYNCFFIIDVIVSDDDSMKSSKGKLDEEIPEPSFLAYPSHRVNVVAKHIFSIVN